jgi:hypothetical protein
MELIWNNQNFILNAKLQDQIILGRTDNAGCLTFVMISEALKGRLCLTVSLIEARSVGACNSSNEAIK